MIIFVTGGVRSGKSAYAERRAVDIHKKNNGNLYYLATSDVYDEEMEQRVNLHKRQRERLHVKWNVIEQQTNIVVSAFQRGDVVLLDCMTTLVSNELFSGWQEEMKNWEKPAHQLNVIEKLKEMLLTLKHSPWTTIIVSNELAFEPLTKDEGTITYLKILGQLHQILVRLAEEAIHVESGLPQLMKGGY